MRRRKPSREHRWLSRRRRASLEGVGDVAQRSHAAIDGRVSLGRGGAEGAGRARVHASGWAGNGGGRCYSLGTAGISHSHSATQISIDR